MHICKKNARNFIFNCDFVVNKRHIVQYSEALFEDSDSDKKRATLACHSECLHNGIILIVYVLLYQLKYRLHTIYLQILLQRYELLRRGREKTKVITEKLDQVCQSLYLLLLYKLYHLSIPSLEVFLRELVAGRLYSFC